MSGGINTDIRSIPDPHALQFCARRRMQRIWCRSLKLTPPVQSRVSPARVTPGHLVQEVTTHCSANRKNGAAEHRATECMVRLPLPQEVSHASLWGAHCHSATTPCGVHTATPLSQAGSRWPVRALAKCYTPLWACLAFPLSACCSRTRIRCGQ